MRQITVKLAEIGADPLVGHEGLVHEVVLREPSFDDYLALGEPRQFYLMADGETAVPLDDPALVRQYVERCLVKPQDSSLLSQGGLKLARALKATVIGFFQHGDEAGEASRISPTSSSSTDASPSTPAP